MALFVVVASPLPKKKIYAKLLSSYTKMDTKDFMPHNETTSRNAEIYQKMCELIPGGVDSPVRAYKGLEVTPVIAVEGKGGRLTDADGRTFIDLLLSWGALPHGHAHPEIVQAASKRAALGTTFGLSCPSEMKLAGKIISHMSSIERIRFVSSGTEATMSAIRLARGFTKRDKIVKFTGNYHGASDSFLVQAGSGVALYSAASSAGLPAEVISNTLCVPYNDVAAARKLFQEQGAFIAAAIVEPIAANMGVVPGTAEFLNTLRQETEKAGALLIFDEVVTGFRVGLGGAQSLYKIKPDLTCLGKIMGGGFPAAAFGGRRDIMETLAPLGPVYHGGTLSGNPVAMEAGLKAIELLEKPGTFEELQRKADIITLPVRERLRKLKAPACVQQVGSMFTLFFGRDSVKSMEEARQLDPQLFKQFLQQMLQQGILIPPLQVEAWFVCTTHEDKDLQKARDAILAFVDEQF